MKYTNFTAEEWMKHLEQWRDSENYVSSAVDVEFHSWLIPQFLSHGKKQMGDSF